MRPSPGWCSIWRARRSDRTLVIVASEFSRDMMMEGKPGSSANDQTTDKVDVIKELKHYGLHRHFTALSVVMFGGGMKKGHVYGATSPTRPSVAIEKLPPGTLYRCPARLSVHIPRRLEI